MLYWANKCYTAKPAIMAACIALLDAVLPACKQQAWQQLVQHTCTHGS